MYGTILTSCNIYAVLLATLDRVETNDKAFDLIGFDYYANEYIG